MKTRKAVLCAHKSCFFVVVDFFFFFCDKEEWEYTRWSLDLSDDSSLTQFCVQTSQFTHTHTHARCTSLNQCGVSLMLFCLSLMLFFCRCFSFTGTSERPLVVLNSEKSSWRSKDVSSVDDAILFSALTGTNCVTFRGLSEGRRKVSQPAALSSDDGIWSVRPDQELG